MSEYRLISFPSAAHVEGNTINIRAYALQIKEHPMLAWRTIPTLTVESMEKKESKEFYRTFTDESESPSG